MYNQKNLYHRYVQFATHNIAMYTCFYIQQILFCPFNDAYIYIVDQLHIALNNLSQGPDSFICVEREIPPIFLEKYRYVHFSPKISLCTIFITHNIAMYNNY